MLNWIKAHPAKAICLVFPTYSYIKFLLLTYAHFQVHGETDIFVAAVMSALGFAPKATEDSRLITTIVPGPVDPYPPSVAPYITPDAAPASVNVIP